MWCVCDRSYLCIQLSVHMLRKSLHLMLINRRMSLCLLKWVLAPLLTTVLVDLERRHYLEESMTSVICKMKNSLLKVRGSSNNSLWCLKRAKKEFFYDSYALKRLQDTAKAWFWPPLHGAATSGFSFGNWLPSWIRSTTEQGDLVKIDKITTLILLEKKINKWNIFKYWCLRLILHIWSVYNGSIFNVYFGP